MVYAALRFFNSSYHARRLNKDTTAPPDLELGSSLCARLQHNINSMCQELHKKGKGIVKQQETFSPDELTKLLQCLEGMPDDGYKHLVTGYLALSMQFGGRVSDYPKFTRR